jgi:hypothetical protein
MYKLLAILAAIWRVLSHEITIWIMLIGSCLALGAILAHGYSQPGPLEQNTAGAGICLTIMAAAFAVSYIRDCINMVTDEGGDDVGDV